MIAMISKNNWNGILATAIIGLLLTAGEIVDLVFKMKVPYTTFWKVIKISVIIQELINSILMLRYYSLRNDDPPASLRQFGLASSAILLMINTFLTLTAFYITVADLSSVGGISDEDLKIHDPKGSFDINF